MKKDLEKCETKFLLALKRDLDQVLNKRLAQEYIKLKEVKK